MKDRVLPAVVMILVVAMAIGAHVVTGIPFVLALVIAVGFVCWLELERLTPTAKSEAKCVSLQRGIINAGIFAAIICWLIPGDTVLFSAVVPNGLIVIVLIMISTIILENTIAWAIGSMWRKLKKKFGLKPPRPAYPVYSPNKTVVGSAAGVIGGITLGIWLVIALCGEATAEFRALLIVLVCMTPPFAEWGDWLESRMKRKVGVKDSNELVLLDDGLLWHLTHALGGHGGFVDRTDAMFFCLVWAMLPIGIYRLIVG